MGKLKTKTKVVIISCVSAAVVVAAGSIATYMYFQKKNAPGWHEKDGIAYFNLDNGQKATEIHTIKGKKYYFDKSIDIIYLAATNIEYDHEIKTDNMELEKESLEILITYKHLRSKLDKSNFRKKIVKYCAETNLDISKKGYRPSKMYTFKVLKGDIWL